jgi:hypothetical protein
MKVMVLMGLGQGQVGTVGWKLVGGGYPVRRIVCTLGGARYGIVAHVGRVAGDSSVLGRGRARDVGGLGWPQSRDGTAVMVATHNQRSLAYVLDRLAALGCPPATHTTTSAPLSLLH